MDLANDTRPTKRSRSSVACNRCKERRQKCDNAAPICTNCSKAGSECAYKGGDHPAWYVESLEDKIVRLERALAEGSQSVPSVSSGSPAYPNKGSGGPPTPTPTAVPSTIHDPSHHQNQYPSTTSFAPPASSQSSRHQPFPPSHLGNALGFLSLCASAEPYYVGSSTGFSLANLVQAAVYDRLNAVETDVPSPASAAVSPEAVRNLPSTGDRPFSCHRPRSTTKPASMPSDELGTALIAAYTDKVHSIYPFLDELQLKVLHRERHKLKEGGTPEGEIGSAKLHLVYGIGARHLQLLGTSRVTFDRSLPEAHFTAAAGALNIAFELRSTDSIEILLLLAIYSLHSPAGPGAWQLTGMAIRLCIELGLHRRSRTQSTSTASRPDPRRKCLFWSCLILERKVATTLGRPFSLSDNNIDVEYPCDLPTPTCEGAKSPPMVVNSQLARLQSITSRIQTINGRVGDHGLPSATIVMPIQAELDLWRNGCPPQDDGLQLEYHKAVLLLLQPFLTDPNRDAQTFGNCTRAAGAVCQTYKRIHQRRPAGFFLLELHDVLVAGITLIYSLWNDQYGNDSFTVLKDLGACSTVLFLIAERWESAKRYRDAFEALANATSACLSRRSTMPTTQTTNNLNLRTPLDLGSDGQVLFDASLWGNDDSSTWKGMLGEITGAVDPGIQDWSWFTDPSFLNMQA